MLDWTTITFPGNIKTFWLACGCRIRYLSIPGAGDKQKLALLCKACRLYSTSFTGTCIMSSAECCKMLWLELVMISLCVLVHTRVRTSDEYCWFRHLQSSDVGSTSSRLPELWRTRADKYQASVAGKAWGNILCLKNQEQICHCNSNMAERCANNQLSWGYRSNHHLVQNPSLTEPRSFSDMTG